MESHCTPTTVLPLMINCNIVVYFPRAGLLLFCFFILLHIEICNCLHTMSETQVVADAFKTVSGDARYRGRWIQDSDYAAIIRLEYGLQSDHLLSHDLL